MGVTQRHLREGEVTRLRLGIFVQTQADKLVVLHHL